MFKIRIGHVDSQIKEMVGQFHIKEIEQIINIFFHQIHNNYPALQNNSILVDRLNKYIFVY